MPRLRPLWSNFTSGIWSPKLRGRSDVAKYYNGAAELTNVIVRNQGGVDKRSGSRYVAAVKTASKATRLIPFEFSTTQAYIIELGDQYARFYRDGIQIESGGSPVEIATPWLEAELFEVQFAQSADVLYLVHPSHKPRTITRTSHTAWSLANYAPTADPFTSAGNYPRAVGFHEQRLLFGGTNNAPSKIWSTKAADFGDMTTGSNDADAFVYTIASGRVNAINWLAAGEDLLIGTNGAEFRATGGQNGITPTEISIRRQTTQGCAYIMPAVVDAVLLYVQKGLRKVREFAFVFADDKYRSPDLLLLAEDLTGVWPGDMKGIVEIAYQSEPVPILWAVTVDGRLLGMTYDRSQDVVAWHEHTTQGYVESVAVIPATGGDQVWIVVRRSVNGATVRYVEYLDDAFTRAGWTAFYVDSGLTYDAPLDVEGITAADPTVVTITGHGLSDGDEVIVRDIPSTSGMTELNDRSFTVANGTTDTFELLGEDSSGYAAYVSGGQVRKKVTTITGLSHLEGETVKILADGATQPDKTVASGAITLSENAGTVHVGLGYTARLKTLPLAVADGQLMQLIKGWGTIAVRVFATGPLTINGRPAIFRRGSDPMDRAPPLRDGIVRMQDIGWSDDAQITVESDYPVPMSILSIGGNAEVSDD